ncbi:hypothetical protein CHLRE_09g399650v5 [Chlamydomonas reinhardtii]|uniref:Uncharacterized protein n=1 Tax=Chlamydomonas reinhardtii TaxID=3055 RepID=A0A2K3DCW7_CHLRE|nr:uncharacterized protein CHLRE_09g399650v5 [Chlamydomonas reinhardtii]PNW78384.1 hypothetical protein CHLRE_09g399650v5 [Chlamydomonas reinhardtii]
MDQTQRQMMREALFGVGFKEAQISSFADATLDKLCAANFHASGRLQSATREDLKDAGLAPGDVGFIMGKVQGAAAGLGVASVAGAGGASLTSPIPRIGMTGLVTAGAFLMLFKAVVQAVCSIEAEPGCPAWVTSSAALGDAPLSKVLLYGGVWAYMGAHQLAALAAERMQLQAGVYYVGSVLPGWVRFVPAWVRHFTAWAAVQGLAFTAALVMHGASVLVHSLVLDLAVRLGMWLRFR